jgi:hypothetical protein
MLQRCAAAAKDAASYTILTHIYMFMKAVATVIIAMLSPLPIGKGSAVA